MSNIISAKERKRQIRERRKSLQSQTAATTSANHNPNNESRSKLRKLHDSSNLSLDNSYSRASTAYLSCEGTRDAGNSLLLESNTKGDESGAAEAVVSSMAPRSLFSAVMSRSSVVDDRSDLRGEENLLDNATDNNDSSELKQSNANIDEAKQNNVSFDINTSTPTKSPTKRGVFTKANSPGRSPGGYSIRKALDGVSDFTQSLYDMRHDGDEDDNPSQDTEETYRIARIFTRLVPLHLNNELSELNENANSNNPDAIIEETKLANSASINTTFYQEPIGINVTDWSLKKRVRLLSTCASLPGSVKSCFSGRKKWVPPDDGVIHQLAIHYLTKSNQTQPEIIYGEQPSLEEAAMAKWTAATMYFQHPAVHPLPINVLLEGNNPSTEDTNQNLSEFNNRSTYTRVRLPGIGSMGGLGASEKLQKSIRDVENAKSATSSHLVSSFPTLLDKRICEWQETFRSMYQCWQSKLISLGKLMTYSERSKRPTTDEISRCCFYSISPSQVILFRVGVSKSNQIYPAIAFSSTTSEFRSKLMSMGAKLKLLQSNNAEKEFTEDMLESSAPTQHSTEGEAADLRALREANNSSMDNRPTEVEVTQKKKVQNDSKASSIPPLYVSGDDDCAIVYELILNTCGFSVSGTFGNWQFVHDVPLLICRSIGQCVNTILKKLSVSARRDNAYWAQLNNQDGEQSDSVMELYGPILPCALRDLMCASINWVVLDEKLEECSAFDVPTQPMGRSTDVEKKKSRQVSMFLQAHEGELPNSLSTTTGSASSYFFNGSNMSLSEEENKSNTQLKWNECREGEGLSSLVWNADCAKGISYNTFFTS